MKLKSAKCSRYLTLRNQHDSYWFIMRDSLSIELWFNVKAIFIILFTNSLLNLYNPTFVDMWQNYLSFVKEKNKCDIFLEWTANINNNNWPRTKNPTVGSHRILQENLDDPTNSDRNPTTSDRILSEVAGFLGIGIRQEVVGCRIRRFPTVGSDSRKMSETVGSDGIL
jgi:hypothetical protein